MRKSEIKLCIIELFTLFILFLITFVTNRISPYYIIVLLVIIFGITVFLVGYEKDRHRFRTDIILNIIIFTVGFQVLTYIAGIFLGFVKNGYSLTFLNIIKNIFPIFLVIIISELLRYEWSTKGERNKLVLVLSAIVFIAIDTVMSIHLYDFSISSDIIKCITIIFLPSIAKNILLTFLSLKFGYSGNITYRLVMELPIYFLPILPNFNLYLEAIIMLLFPLFITYRTYLTFREKKEPEVRKKRWISITASIILGVLLFVNIILTSGIFKYYSIVVGSGSMHPAIQKGDLIIVEKIKKEHLDQINENDILVYLKEKQIIVHRVVNITYENSQYTFETKGDANEVKDPWVIDEKDVIGKVKIDIPYIGYPTVWLNELLGGKENE